jgi:hypothetical protein
MQKLRNTEEIFCQLMEALEEAEDKFGPTSGEVGLILLSLVDELKDDSDKSAIIASFEKRIEKIVAIYQEDLETS